MRKNAGRSIWTNDRGMFWASVAGLFILAWTLYYTREQLRNAEDTSKRQLRAYVSVPTAEVQKFGPFKVFKMILRVENGGQTPAYKLGSRGAVFLDRDSLPETLPIDPTPLEARGFLGPGSHYDLSFPNVTELSPTQYSDIVAGKLALCVWADITYEDAFGENRFVRYRAFYRGNGNPPEDPLTLSQAKGNDGN